MKTVTFKIITYLIILIIFLLIGLNISLNGFYYFPFLDGTFIYFSCFISLLVLTQFLFFNNFLFLKKHKIFSCILYILLLILPIIITLFPSNTNYLKWDDSNIFLNFYNFLSVPFFYPNFNVRITLIIVCTIPFLTLLIPIYFLFTEKTPKGTFFYILESLYKRIYHYIFIILFGIVMSQVPSLYMYPRKIQYLLLSFLVIYLIYFGIKMVISILTVKKINKDNNSNKNLFVVLTLENSFFNLGLSNEFKGFNKLSNNILNNLVIENKSFNIVSYTAIRLNLIDINSYKNIYYLINLNSYSLSFLDKYSKVYLLKKINDISKNYKFKIIAKSNTKFAKEIQKTYKFHFKNKLELKVLKEVVNDNDNIILKEKVDNLLKEVKDIIPNKYIIFGLKQIENSLNQIENFYTILKLFEYCLHYRALKNIVEKDLTNMSEVAKEELKIPTLGTWINYQKIKNAKNKKYDNPEIIEAFNHIDDLFKEERKFKDKTVCFYQDICTYLIKVRNNILVHGVLTYDVSTYLVDDLFTLTKEIITSFLSLNITIKEHDLIQGLFNTSFKALEEKKNDSYLYSYGALENKDLLLEYLDYKNGNILVKSRDNKIKIDEVRK